MFVYASFFFSERTKIKCTCLQSSLWATSHPMWPLLSDTAVLPEEGASHGKKNRCCDRRTVVRRQVLVTHRWRSVDRHWRITWGRIHLGTLQNNLGAMDAQPVCQTVGKLQEKDGVVPECRTSWILWWSQRGCPSAAGPWWKTEGKIINAKHTLAL